MAPTVAAMAPTVAPKLDTCGECGERIQEPSHFCDICKRANHPFHGVRIGDEGHGSVVRCRSHEAPRDRVPTEDFISELLDAH